MMLMFFAAIVETALYLTFNSYYYKLGPALRREEWQSRVTPDAARAAMEHALIEGPLVGRARSDVLCIRRRVWDWGLQPRLLLRYVEAGPGTSFVCETRPFIGIVFLGLAIFFFLAAHVHLIVAISILPLLILLCRATWMRDARYMSRLSPLRTALRGIGIQICEYCGYDLHGHDLSRPCPECGRRLNERGEGVRREDILLVLEQRADSRKLIALVKLFAGLPVCLLGPIVISTMLWFAVMALFRGSASWLWIFGPLALVMIPLLFRMERQTRGRYFDDSFHAINDRYSGFLPLTHIGPGSGGGLMGRAIAGVVLNPEGTASIFVEVFLLGPRIVLSALSHLRGARVFEDLDRNRIVDAVQALLKRQTGVSPSELLKSGETIGDIVPALAWLGFHGWLGVVGKAERVFLYEESRRIFCNPQGA